jgi:hypothetical protein
MKREEFFELGKNNKVKKVYMNLHMVVKGDEEYEGNNQCVGPKEAPG